MPEDAPRRPSPLWGPVLSAILLALAFAGAWPLVFVALVPWLLSLRETTPRQAWNRGYAFGLLFSLTQLWWLGALAYKWTGSALLGLAPWLLASLLSAVYYGLLGRLVRSCHELGAAWAIPLVWAGMEVFRSYIPVFAFPWALLGEPLVGTPVIGLAWWGTIYLASAAVVAVNAALVRRSPVGLAATVGAAGLALLAWNVRTRPLPFEDKALTVAAGQPGVDMAVPDGSSEWKIAAAVDALTAEAAGVGASILVFPEGITRGGATIPPHTDFAIPDRPALVFGGQRGLGPTFQSAFGVAEGRWDVADKTRLVIFGEFVPGRDVLPFLSAFHLPTGDLSAGEKLEQLRFGTWRVGPLVCFEALFPDLGLRQARLDPDFLAVMSIDDWFQDTPAPARLAEASRWRAVEAGAQLVRAGSLGKTMIVAPTGAILSEAPYGGRRLVVASLHKGPGPFPLVWLFPAVSLASLVGVPLARRWRGGSGLASSEKAPLPKAGQN